ncbi:MAG: RnfABCDGE type electron transport complex subunit G [bacterium]|nr:MAG: RnfABCDGE type electron transport complex subunit G [bacterium]
MKDIVKLGLILLLVTAVAGAALSVVNNITKPRIEEQKRLVTERALIAALPAADKNAIDPVKIADTTRYYIGYKDTLRTTIVGYAFVARGAGYSSTIETMVGVDTNGSISGIKIMEQKETPGLGTKIEEIYYGETTSWFQDQFIGKIAQDLAVDKDGGEITSVTGATISSRAVANSINVGLEKLEKQLGGFKSRVEQLEE